jgi:gamma-glutamylcyclotransferase (GGCT)/AIG2-like uncharacterized protein YtfP
MKKRCPSAKVVSKAKKLNYKLCFPIISQKRGNKGVASIKKSKGNVVEGALYHISSMDLLQLDKFEANGHRYERKKVYVSLKNNIKKLVWTYIAISDHLENNLPSDLYLNLFISGASEQKLSKKYIERLKRGKAYSPL